MGRGRSLAALSTGLCVTLATLLMVTAASARQLPRRTSPIASVASPSPGEAAASSPESSPEPIASVSATWGTGPVDLTDPTIGLDALSDYVASLTVTFDGVQAGTPVSASTTTTLSASPRGRELTIDRGPDGPATYRAEVGGAAYTKDGDEPCTVGSIVEGETIRDLYEPSAHLPPLGGLEAGTSESVDGAPARHHAFDLRSVVALGLSSATGEVWVADPGDHVVRYVLTVEAGPAYLGEDTTGTRTLDYRLSIPDRPITIELPKDCPPVLPLLADATDVVRSGDLLSFRSAMPLAKAAKAYAADLKSAGWKPTRPGLTKSRAQLGARKGKRDLNVVMRADADGVAVWVVLLD